MAALNREHLAARARRGPARGPRRSGSRRATASRTSRPATCSARDRARDGARPARSSRSTTRRARPRRPDDRAHPRAARRRTTRAAASCSTASRARWRRPRRSTRCSREIGRALDVVLEFQLPDEVAIERLLERARRGGPHRRHARGDRASGSSSTTARPSRSSSTTARTGNLVGIHADRPVDEVFAEIQEALEQAAARDDHPQEPGRDRADGRAPASVVAETLALSGREHPPGVTTAELDAIAEEFIRSRGGVPTFKGYRGYPGRDLHLAELDGRPRHPRPVHASRTATSSRSTSASRSTASSPTPRTRSPVGEISAEARAAARRLPGGARGGHRAGAGRQPHRRTSRHAVQRTTEDAGFSVVRSLVGHGVGRSMHEDPQIPNFGEPGRGPMLAAGHDARDRADDQRRRAGRLRRTTTNGRSRPRTGRSSAHFEHTVAVTDDGPRILTRRLRSEPVCYHDLARREPCCAVSFCRVVRRSRARFSRKDMSVKEEKIEVEGEVIEALPSTMFRVQLDRRPRRARDDLREDAQALHPDPPGRQGQGRALAVRPRPAAGSPTRYPMKVRPSVKPMCERCRVIKRHGATMVICTNPRHKQRQG